MAATTPNRMAMLTQRISAIEVSMSVAGMRSVIISSTGRPASME